MGDALKAAAATTAAATAEATSPIAGGIRQAETSAMDNAADAIGEMRRRIDAWIQSGAEKPAACVITFGCQMNENDSEKISGIIENMGYRLTRPGAWLGGSSAADVDGLPSLVVVNTCSVRKSAEQRFYGILGACKRLKGACPSTIVAVCGCMAHMPSAVEHIIAHYPIVDFMFGTDGLHRLPELLLAAGAGAGVGGKAAAGAVRGRPLRAQDEPRGIVEGLPFSRKPPPAARVSVMYGCDNHCAYCVVPRTRGRERSRGAGAILGEVEGLAAGGYREVMLLGQNVNAYGKDLPPGAADFADLLRRVAAVPGILRVRFMTSHPKDLSDRLIDAVADTPQVERHVHLPMQSGSDSVLGRMNRHYTRKDYARLVEKIRERVPGASITTDIIVGFPGETEQDFEDTLDMVAHLRFDAAYTFIYSPREGTPAAGFGGSVELGVAQGRFSRLLELQNEISLQINRRLVGRRVEALCEGASKTDPGRRTGRTSEGKIVNFDIDEAGTGQGDQSAKPGELVLVDIDGAHTWSLSGRLAGAPCPRGAAG